MSASHSKVKETNKNIDNSSFKRGGVRATAGPRIGWSNTMPKSLPVG